MQLFLSLLLLNVLTFISNGDICITTEDNYAFQGNYIDMGTDSNGNKYYKEVDVGSCDSNYIFKFGSKFYIGQAYDANEGTGSGLFTSCNTENIETPTECQSWGVAMTVTDGSCPEILTNTCGSIVISGAHSMLDGQYDKTTDGLYSRVDNAYYLSFWENGRQYVLNTAGDVRCSDGSGSHYVRFGESQLDGITVNQEISVTPDYHCCASTVSIACTTAALPSTGTGTGSGTSNTPSPTTPPSPVDVALGSDSLCYAVLESAADSGYSIIASGVTTEIITIAGQYALIRLADENGKPIYQLSGCGKDAYITYVTSYAMYMVVLDINNAATTYVSYCQNSGSITNNDITQCVWSRGDKYTITDSISSCDCGQTVETI